MRDLELGPRHKLLCDLMHKVEQSASRELLHDPVCEAEHCAKCKLLCDPGHIMRCDFGHVGGQVVLEASATEVLV